MAPRYQEVADKVRSAILRGDYTAGDRLPLRTELAISFGVSRETIAKVHRILVGEGLIAVRRRYGAVVLEQPRREHTTRHRVVHRDERGYVVDRAEPGWELLAAVTVRRMVAPWEIVGLLDIPAGSEIVCRATVIGDPASRQAHELTTSSLPVDLVDALPILEADDPGPGGIYARLEDAGHGPLTWYELVSARAATPTESTTLRLATGEPVLQIHRTATDPTGRVCEVTTHTLSAAHHDIGYPLSRDPSATHPEPRT